MALKFRDTPQVDYGNNRNADDWRDRFPPRAQPIATAPANSGTPVTVFEANGHQHEAMYHCGRWVKVVQFRDPRTQEVRRKMDGTTLNPVMWESK